MQLMGLDRLSQSLFDSSVELRAVPWDVVVIDEAHKLRNAHRTSRRTGQALKCALAGRKKLLFTNQGKTRWMIIDEAFNSDKLIEFLEALIKDAGKKIFLILDNLRVHHSKPVKAWAAERQDKIELFYLPSYSPELNPEERLNADLKHAIGTKVPVRTKAKLKLAATEHMVKLEQSPERVRSFFQDPRVKYAA
jgi:transposase